MLFDLFHNPFHHPFPQPFPQPFPVELKGDNSNAQLAKCLETPAEWRSTHFPHQRHLLLQHAFQIARQQIDFQINLAAFAQQANGGDLMGMRNDIDRKPRATVIEINDLIDG